MSVNLKTIVVTTRTRTTRVEFTPDEIEQILREYSGLLNSTVEFDTGHDFLRGVILTDTTVTEESDAPL